MTLANLQRSLGFVLAISAIGFLAILAFPPDRQGTETAKQVVTADIQHPLEGAGLAQ
jgi:hypothetical protein